MKDPVLQFKVLLIEVAEPLHQHLDYVLRAKPRSALQHAALLQPAAARYAPPPHLGRGRGGVSAMPPMPILVHDRLAIRMPHIDPDRIALTAHAEPDEVSALMTKPHVGEFHDGDHPWATGPARRART